MCPTWPRRAQHGGSGFTAYLGVSEVSLLLALDQVVLTLFHSSSVSLIQEPYLPCDA